MSVYLYVCLGPRKATEVDRKYLISLSDKLSCLIPSRYRRGADTDQPQVLYCYLPVLCLLQNVYGNISSFRTNYHSLLHCRLFIHCLWKYVYRIVLKTYLLLLVWKHVRMFNIFLLIQVRYWPSVEICRVVKHTLTCKNCCEVHREINRIFILYTITYKINVHMY